MHESYLPESTVNSQPRARRIGRRTAALVVATGVSLGVGGCGGGSGNAPPKAATGSPINADTLPLATNNTIQLPHCHDFKGNSYVKTATGEDLGKLVTTALALKSRPTDTDMITGTAICDPSTGRSDTYQVHEDDSFAGNYGGDDCAVVGTYTKDPTRSVVVCVNPTVLQ